MSHSRVMLSGLRPGQIILFLAIVLVPLGIAAWLGLEVAENEQKVGQSQFQSLLESRLRDVDGTIARAVADAERHLLERVIPADVTRTTTLDQVQVDALRQLRREEPLIREVFVVAPTGFLQFPPGETTVGATGNADAEAGPGVGEDGSGASSEASSDASEDERAFRERTAAIWRGDAVLYEPPSPEGARAPEGRSPSSGESDGGVIAVGPGGDRSAARESPGTMVKDARLRGDTVLTLARSRDHGWIAWYWQEGLHLLLWRRAADGGVIGVEVERVVLWSRIVGKLPASRLDDGRVTLLDARGHPIHQWGPYEPSSDEQPAVTAAVTYPLHSWRLAHFVSPRQRRAVFGQTLRLNLILGLSAVALALCAMAFLFYRDYSRRMRDAAQRVNFVTQVSHELKTPLTNIRLYAELLEGNLDEDDERSRHRAEVIIAESQRLTRLINNILTFSKQRRDRVESHRAEIALDGLVSDVMEQFAPALAARGIEQEVTTGSSCRVHADPDAIGQIVANLVSNVEKYAASGGHIAVQTGVVQDGRGAARPGDEERDGDVAAFIRVSDRGPGIPPRHRDKIFRPFYRVSDELADGVTGTGIGLAIARELARKNGAELRLLDVPEGACFELLFPRAARQSREATEPPDRKSPDRNPGEMT